MSAHLTYLEAVVTGLIQGVTELFPVSSLGHNVLLPALIGGSWASSLNVSAPNSPYLAFIVGLHVATAIAMIVYFWRDWLRIVRGFFSSLRTRSITTPDERLAWMIILATIPVGIVGVALQKEFTKVFAKPELAAVFLAINGVILLGSERMRRSREAAAGPSLPATAPRERRIRSLTSRMTPLTARKTAASSGLANTFVNSCCSATPTMPTGIVARMIIQASRSSGVVIDRVRSDVKNPRTIRSQSRQK